VLRDPHRAIVTGPSRPRGALMTSPDIRAGMAMLLAAVCAEGISTINNGDQIERGYERIDERLNALGARITRVPARSRYSGKRIVGDGRPSFWPMAMLDFGK
jgi:UDP-N-acetylglucosamine 1-carboxyvinyltransferase